MFSMAQIRLNNINRMAFISAASHVFISSSNRLHMVPLRALKRAKVQVQRYVAAVRHGTLLPPANDIPLLGQAAKLFFAAFLALCLQLGFDKPPAQASAAEDNLLMFSRGVDQQLDSLFNLFQTGDTSSSTPTSQDKIQQNRNLIAEIAEVVENNFADVRNGGFDIAKWQHLVSKAQEKQLPSTSFLYNTIRGLLLELKDPYSRFLTPVEFSGMLKYDITGVGINLGTPEEFVAKSGLSLPSNPGKEKEEDEGEGGIYVVGLVSGLAADKAGLQQGDEVLEVGGQPVKQLSPFQVASLFQDTPANTDDTDSSSNSNNKNNSLVTIKVKKYSNRQIELLTLVKPIITLPSPVKSNLVAATSSSLPVGVVKLSNFNAKAQHDVAAAIQKLTRQGAQRLVLDLRGNRGGLVSEGIEVARLFLDDGDTIVQTIGSRKLPKAPPVVALQPPSVVTPLVVLVDSHTASASEILAGALKDNCRGVLVGGRTYGKGLIQSVYELSDGSGLVLTVGKYVTPNGVDIDLEGLVPDFGNIPSKEKADEALRMCKINRKDNGL
jgi:carboxyl-terminal processing protease